MSLWKKIADVLRYPGSKSPQAMFNKAVGESMASGTQGDWNPGAEEWSKMREGHTGYRNPAPGNASIDAKMDVPTTTGDKMFDIKYYSRDTRRSRVHSDRSTMSHPALGIDASPEPPRLTGSPGTFANPAVATYDETGLRSAMNATHEAMNASIEKYLPTHLPGPAWSRGDAAAAYEERAAEMEKLGLPPTPGYPKSWNRATMMKAREYKW